MSTQNREKQNTLKILIISILILGCFACANQPVNQEPPAYQVIKSGQVLQLNENLLIPPESATVYLQNGAITQGNKIDQWSPNCRIVVERITENERTIQPDEFVVTGIRYERTYAANKPVMYASLFDTAESGLPIAEEFVIYLALKSDKQPFVKTLVCKHWEDPHNGYHLTMQQIKQALGNLFIFKE